MGFRTTIGTGLTTATMPSSDTGDTRAVWMLLAATALMATVHLLPTPEPLVRNGELIALTPEGKTCLAILLFAVTLWVSEAMPFAATSLFVVLLIPAFGIADFATAVNAGFGNPLILFFIGVLFLSTGFTLSGLGTRMVLHVLRLAGTRTDRVLLGFLVVGALLSMWITDMAVAAVLLPLGVGVLRDAQLRPLESNFGRALMISCAYGPLIGGIGTPAGTAANLIALSYLEELAGVSISFGQWMLVGVPASLLMIPIGWRLLLWFFPPEIDVLPFERHEIDAKLAALGPLTPVERKTLAIFGLTITAWLVTPWLADVTGGRVDPPIQAVALAGGLTMFLPTMRVMTWKEAQQNMDWGGVMLIAAGLSARADGLRNRSRPLARAAAAWRHRVDPDAASPVRHRARGGAPAPALLEQHGDRVADHADFAGAGARRRTRRLVDRRPGGLYLVARLHPRHREPDQRAALLRRLLLDPRHGKGRRLDDPRRRCLCDRLDHARGAVGVTLLTWRGPLAFVRQ